ncbi:hypothetical protein EJ05DRAFT_505328 [Pseudovirgaria hyperparasitica]|uniref:G-patch domain-containing protein n=1 Tax=Pseudovirgaria hyperparasitica TaxID=470096 RepID=A0A6A6VSK3_9PEZI|nr:uncharacterized protein EJ05DRAFT_505328 [Pseudovirgaria hyperparasitica]KAF2753135.1 hypothetical protein EJ05DRAFT_505328 [Pseudovirgaria hyperparasitica]
MDAANILKAQGWRGTGHSLDSEGRGLAKPLLVSNKQDLLGIGKKKNLVSDQWWMRAFDESLKELGTGNKTTLQSITEKGVSRGGLYGFFVRGEGLQGTIGAESTLSVSTIESLASFNTSDRSSSEPPSATSSSESTTMTKKAKVNKRRLAAKDDAFLKKMPKKCKLSDAENYEIWLPKLQKTQRKLATRDAEMNSVTLEEQLKRVGWDVPPATFNETKRQFILLKKHKRQALYLQRTVEEVIKHGDTLGKKIEEDKKAAPPLQSALAELPAKKLENYKKRALEKGLSVEAYYEARQKKRRAKKRRQMRGDGFISLDAEEEQESSDDDGKTKKSWIKVNRDKILMEMGKNPATATKDDRKAAVRYLKRQNKAKKKGPEKKGAKQRQGGRN